MSNEKAKGTEPEKALIRELLAHGHTVEEVCAKYAHIDGRVISGIAARIRVHGPPETGGAGGQPPSENPAAPAVAGGPAYRNPEDVTPGLTPMAGATGTSGGLTPAYLEYLVVEKVDQPNAGVIKREMPPFGINELLDRYDPGEYKIEHYRDGKIFRVLKNTVSPLAKQTRAAASGIPTVIREAPRVESPSDIFMRAMETYDRMRGGSRNEEAHIRSVEAQAKIEEVKAKAQLETVQTAGLIDLIKTERNRPVEKDHSLTDMVALMREERETARTRLTDELTLMRERHTQDMAMERQRIEARDKEKDKDLDARLIREREHAAALQSIETKRQELFEKRNEEASENLKQMRASLTEELDERRKQHEELLDLQKKHTTEMIALREKSAGADKDLEVAKIIKEGITGGLDRIGARVDMLVEGGILKKPGQPAGGGTTAQKTMVDSSGKTIEANPATAETPPAAKKGEKMLTADDIKAMVNEPWFNNLQKEILRDINKRVKYAAEPALKPHGSMIGQIFLDKMNADPSYRVHFHYLRSREWDEILADIKEAVKPEDLVVFGHKEGHSWFNELQRFLIGAWNSSMGISG